MSKGIKGVIFDIDGVLEFQGKSYASASETVNELRDRGYILRFLTNSTLKSRKTCTEKLKRINIEVSEEEVITASYATAQYLNALNPDSCWIMQAGDGLDEFSHFISDDISPEYVIIGDYRSKFNFDSLNKALRFLINGSKLIGMMSELIDTSGRETELDAGSWVQMLERASGVNAVYIGKQYSYVFNLTLEGMKLEKSEVIMVGDQVITDIIGAINFGIKSILLKTGEFKKEDLNDQIKPDYIFNSLNEILTVLNNC